jgi:REP element-mobilizing transposase RayT
VLSRKRKRILFIGAVVLLTIDSGHSKHRVLFHLVFIPKYRRRILEGALASRIRSLFEQACDVKGWRIHELGIQPDQ